MTDASDPNDPSAPERPDVSGQSMWGGRFSAKPAELMQAINVSIGFDRRLAPQDL
jgi:argininosuccinate lyase